LRTPPVHLLAALALFAPAVIAAAPALRATQAWIRALPGTDVAAAYLTLTNTGTQPITVVGVRSSVAAQAMIHETKLVGATSSMRPRESLLVAPGATVRFAPDGLHVMLHGLSHALKPGDDVPLVLLLGDGTTLTVTAHVRALDQE
jgi:periplasmic copper chaperone A